MNATFQIYHWTVIAILGLTLLTLAVNLCFFRSLRPVQSADRKKAPLVSVLIPARNEALRISPCVASLLAQDYPNYELLVLDDHSEDGTSEVLRKLGMSETVEAPRRIVRGAALPEGWTGKSWACAQLANVARGEFLFFTDADTVHAPQTISAAVAHNAETRADLLSAWPRLVTRTWSEKLVITFLPVMGLAIFPHWLLAFLQGHPACARAIPTRMLRSLGAANGQFLFFRKASYEAIGGHAAVRSHLVEDVALGREVTQRMGDGMRLINCDGSRLVDCRMYSRFSEVWEGFTKNARPAFENAHWAWWLMGVSQFAAWLLPFALLLVPSQRELAVFEVGVIYLVRVILTLRMRTSWLGCWLHPLGHALAMAIALNSWRLSSRRGVLWKGRLYRAD
ncbi:MAG: hypothetical protein QOD99_1881 [Chthoniobacter sp.]|jgi:chlorobactene glucosyltransferase|nr:hypothetical protein [Chthoniobacter sp.]